MDNIQHVMQDNDGGTTDLCSFIDVYILNAVLATIPIPDGTTQCQKAPISDILYVTSVLDEVPQITPSPPLLDGENSEDECVSGTPLHPRSVGRCERLSAFSTNTSSQGITRSINRFPDNNGRRSSCSRWLPYSQWVPGKGEDSKKSALQSDSIPLLYYIHFINHRFKWANAGYSWFHWVVTTRWHSLWTHCASSYFSIRTIGP